jgi:hypothetical protein
MKRKSFLKFKVMGSLEGDRRCTVLAVVETPEEAHAVEEEYQNAFGDEVCTCVKEGVFKTLLTFKESHVMHLALMQERRERKEVYRKLGLILGALQSPMAKVASSIGAGQSLN